MGNDRFKPYHIALAIILVLVVLCGGAVFVINTGSNAVDKIREIMPGAMVVKDGHVVAGPTEEILELATASKVIDVTYDFKANFLGLERSITLRGQFMAKAGIEVDGKFKFLVSKDGKTVRVQHSPAQILSCEMLHYDVVKESQWWLNQLSTEDREAALQAFLKLARKHAEESTLPVDATNGLSRRLEPLRMIDDVSVIMEPLP